MASRNIKNFEFRLGRQGILFFVAGMSVILFVVFILGVAVGLHIDAYPEKIARQMPEIIRKQLHPAPEKTGNVSSVPLSISRPPLGAGVKEAPEADDNKQRQAALTAPSGVLNAGPAAGKVPAAAEEAGGQVPVTEPVSKERDGKSTPAERSEKASEPIPKAGGKYLVQAGSFKNEEKAKEFCQRITKVGYNARVVLAKSAQQGKWFRVVITGFGTKAEAKTAARVVSEKMKGVSCFVRLMK